MKNVPVELLVYVVDTTASIPELQWAYSIATRADELIGASFFDVPYDWNAFARGARRR